MLTLSNYGIYALNLHVRRGLLKFIHVFEICELTTWDKTNYD